jgi:thioredoxin 1
MRTVGEDRLLIAKPSMPLDVAHWQEFCITNKLIAQVAHTHRLNLDDEGQGGKPVNIRQQEQIPDVTSEGFDRLVINSAIPVLVNFQTPWSKRMVPLLGQLAKAFAGRLQVVQANISTNPELAARFRIRAVPTLLIFKKGVPVEFIVGTVPSRFIFETVCNTLGVAPRSTKTGRARDAGRWPSIWQLAFDSTLT